MRIPSMLFAVLASALVSTPAPAQLVRTIEDHSPGRPARTVPKQGQGPTVGPTPVPSASASLPPPLPVDGSHSAYGNGGLAPAPNIPRWRSRNTARMLGRMDMVWYANRGWRCRRDDGTTGTVGGLNPPGLLYRYASMVRKQSLAQVIAAAPSASFGRQVDSGIVVCR